MPPACCVTLFCCRVTWTTIDTAAAVAAAVATTEDDNDDNGDWTVSSISITHPLSRPRLHSCYGLEDQLLCKPFRNNGQKPSFLEISDLSESLQETTSSPAVSERPRDASCLSVVSFNSTIYVEEINYYFTPAAYN